MKIRRWKDKVEGPVGIPNAVFQPLGLSAYGAFGKHFEKLLATFNSKYHRNGRTLPNAARGHRSFRNFAAHAISVALWEGNARCIQVHHPEWFP